MIDSYNMNRVILAVSLSVHIGSFMCAPNIAKKNVKKQLMIRHKRETYFKKRYKEKFLNITEKSRKNDKDDCTF